MPSLTVCIPPDRVESMQVTIQLIDLTDRLAEYIVRAPLTNQIFSTAQRTIDFDVNGKAILELAATDSLTPETRYLLRVGPSHQIFKMPDADANVVDLI